MDSRFQRFDNLVFGVLRQLYVSVWCRKLSRRCWCWRRWCTFDGSYWFIGCRTNILTSNQLPKILVDCVLFIGRGWQNDDITLRVLRLTKDLGIVTVNVEVFVLVTRTAILNGRAKSSGSISTDKKTGCSYPCLSSPFIFRKRIRLHIDTHVIVAFWGSCSMAISMSSWGSTRASQAELYVCVYIVRCGFVADRTNGIACLSFAWFGLKFN